MRNVQVEIEGQVRVVGLRKKDHESAQGRAATARVRAGVALQTSLSAKAAWEKSLADRAPGAMVESLRVAKAKAKADHGAALTAAERAEAQVRSTAAVLKTAEGFLRRLEAEASEVATAEIFTSKGVPLARAKKAAAAFPRPRPVVVPQPKAVAETAVPAPPPRPALNLSGLAEKWGVAAK